ncbi:hypothetical protein AGLY_012634, partial [Aphis glycines]
NNSKHIPKAKMFQVYLKNTTQLKTNVVQASYKVAILIARNKFITKHNHQNCLKYKTWHINIATEQSMIVQIVFVSIGRMTILPILFVQLLIIIHVLDFLLSTHDRTSVSDIFEKFFRSTGDSEYSSYYLSLSVEVIGFENVMSVVTKAVHHLTESCVLFENQFHKTLMLTLLFNLKINPFNRDEFQNIKIN